MSLCVFVCQREGALGDDDSADMDGENGRGFEEYEWAGQKRIRATALLEGGFRGTNTHTLHLIQHYAACISYDNFLFRGRLSFLSFLSFSEAEMLSVLVCVLCDDVGMTD